MPGGVPTRGAALAAVGAVFAADTAGGPGLVWYEPEVSYTGPVSFTWAVTDSAVPAAELAAGVTSTTFRSEDYIFGAVFSCGPGYLEVTNGTGGAVSCAACGAGMYNTADTFAQAECFGCRTRQAQPLTGQTACLGCAAGTYNAVTGQAACTACPMADAALMTSLAQSQSADECFCRPGSWANGTGAAKVCYGCDPNTLCDEVDQAGPAESMLPATSSNI